MKERHKNTGILLAALGMIYGDIGTSPLYVMRFIVRGSGGAGTVTENTVIGSISLILWSVILLAAGKGVLLLLRTDNRGEGGHFALYALVRGQGRRLIVPAALGGAALLADAFLTPALTMTAAAEGLPFMPIGVLSGVSRRGIVIVVLVLLTALFSLQRLGNRRTGRFFGPVMLLWLLFIGIAGLLQIPAAPYVLRAFDPLCGLRFLFSADNRMGFALLGTVFLAVTGTEVLYANLDFAGRRAITLAWPFVMLSVFLSYLGQGAWLICRIGDGALLDAAVFDPFFLMLPAALRLPGLLLALAAAWTAAQTVINSSFTLVSEAIRLDLLPAVKIRWPSDSIAQEYIPSVNWMLWLGACLAVLGFRSGEQMASAYGLATAAAMLSTTILFAVYIRSERKRHAQAAIVLLLFGLPELIFFAASLGKLLTGGVIAAVVTLALFFSMLAWDRARSIEKKFTVPIKIADCIPQLEALRAADACPFFTDNLVYVETGGDMDSVDKAILWSILDLDLKRARTYWFVSVHTVDEPYAERFRTESFGTEHVFRVDLELGFKCSRPVTWYLRKYFRELQESGVIQPQCRRHYLSEASSYGTFHYCVLQKVPSDAEAFSMADVWAMRIKASMQRVAGFREEWYAEEDTDVSVETIPLDLDAPQPSMRLVRIWPEKGTDTPSDNRGNKEDDL